MAQETVERAETRDIQKEKNDGKQTSGRTLRIMLSPRTNNTSMTLTYMPQHTVFAMCTKPQVAYDNLFIPKIRDISKINENSVVVPIFISKKSFEFLYL